MVVLPTPVAPVTRTRPWWRSASRSDAGWKPELVETGHLARNQAERERDLAALPERVHAEARQAGGLVRGVELARVAEGCEPLRIGGADPLEELFEPRRVERRPAFERAQVPVAANDRRLADLQVEVARAVLDGAL